MSGARGLAPTPCASGFAQVQILILLLEVGLDPVDLGHSSSTSCASMPKSSTIQAFQAGWAISAEDRYARKV